MATLIDDPRAKHETAKAEAVKILKSHLNGLKVGYTANKLAAVTQTPEVKRLIEEAVLRLEREAPSLNIADIKALQAHLIYDTEIAIREQASKKPGKEKPKEASATAHPIQKESPFKAQANIIDKGKNPKNVNTSTAAVIDQSERQVTNNPILASSEPIAKKASPNTFPPQKAKTATHGGDANRGRESKPDRPLSNKSAPVKQTKTPGVFSTSSHPDAQRIAAKVTEATKTANKPPTNKMPEQRTPNKPTNPETAKTTAPIIKHKPIQVVPPVPMYEPYKEEYDDQDISEHSGRGAEVAGNYDTPQGPDSEPYPEQPYQPSSPPSSRPAGGSQPDSGDDGGGGGNGHHLPSRRRMPRFPRKGGGLGGRGSNSLAKAATKKAVLMLARTPWGWIIIAVAFVLGLILYLLFGRHDADELAKRNAAGETLIVTKQKISPPNLEAKVGDIVTFEITVKDQKAAQDVIVIDHLPDGISFLDENIPSTWTKRSFNPVQKTITWKASENIPPGSLNPPNFTITVKYKVIQDKTHLITWAEVNAIPAGGSLSGTWVAPSTSTCDGKYSSAINKTPLDKNFGDPTCNFSKDLLFTLLKQEDPVNANRWFTQIVPCESGFNPNAYLGPEGGTPDAAGAWGLYQMGSSTPPGSAPPAKGKNGPIDRGDVNWEEQTKNATTYGKKLNSLGAYWACARKTNYK